MAPLYSQQLYNAQTTVTGNQTVYTVPAGAVVIVTNIDVFLNNAAAGNISQVQLGNAVVLFRVAPAAEQLTQQWVGKQVLAPGQTIVIRQSGTAARFGITGYVLFT